LCSALLQVWDPICVMQNLGGTFPESPQQDSSKLPDDSGWGTVAYAVDGLAIRDILLCGHSRCCVPAMWVHGTWGRSKQIDLRDLSGDEKLSERDRLSQVSRLRRFLALGRHGSDTKVHAAWIDEEGRRILLYSDAFRRFVIATDSDIESLLCLFNVPRERALRLTLQLRGTLETRPTD
jgi:carbonic anhydrase